MFKPVNYGRLVCRIRSEESCVRIGGGGGGGGGEKKQRGGGGTVRNTVKGEGRQRF